MDQEIKSNKGLIIQEEVSKPEGVKLKTMQDLLKELIKEKELVNSMIIREKDYEIKITRQLEELSNAYKQNSRIRNDRSIAIKENDRIARENILLYKEISRIQDLLDKADSLLSEHKHLFKKAQDAIKEKENFIEDYFRLKFENQLFRDKFIDSEIEVSQYQYEDAKKHNEVQ